MFLTLTAPSFGPVHTRALTPRGHVIPCRCGERHHPDDPRIGTALDPDTYDYTGAVLWQAHAGMLWARFTIALRRALAAALGVKGAEFREHARLSYAKVAEYQRRGLVHFHAVIRLDGPDGPADPPPAGLDLAALRAAITTAAHAVTLTTHRPDGTPLVLGWGTQLDLREVTAAARAQIEDDAGEITDAALAGYIAKYATKGTGATRGRRPADPRHRPRRAPAHQRPPPAHDHHRVGARRPARLRRAQPAPLGAHARLPRALPHQVAALLGHLQSPTRGASDLAAARRPRPSSTPTPPTTTPIPPDLDTITVINDWWPVHYGHRDDGERELAAAIAERRRATRRTTTARRAA